MDKRKKSTENVLSPSILIGKLDPTIYDKFLPPQKALQNESTLVLTDIYVESISSVQEASMDYDIDFYLHLEWYDQRLSHDGNEFVETNDLQIAGQLWWPDLYIANAKESTFPSVTVPNFSVRVYPDGKIWISRRIRATLSCKMHLAKFPSDKQHCGLKLLSCEILCMTLPVRKTLHRKILNHVKCSIMPFAPFPYMVMVTIPYTYGNCHCFLL